jgi:hypothetical protein
MDTESMVPLKSVVGVMARDTVPVAPATTVLEKVAVNAVPVLLSITLTAPRATAMLPAVRPDIAISSWYVDPFVTATP